MIIWQEVKICFFNFFVLFYDLDVGCVVREKCHCDDFGDIAIFLELFYFAFELFLGFFFGKAFCD